MNPSKYAKTTAWLLAAWFATAFTAAALVGSNRAPDGPPLSLLVAVLLPFGIVGLRVAVSRPFREFILSLNPRLLTLVHSWRLGGFVFIVLARYRLLPAVFALPAGFGDMFIGATAAFVASRYADPAHRSAFIRWQIGGIVDLVTAVTLGATAFLWNTGGISTAPMTVLPMSLIPTFAVPLYLLLHIISIAQARRWTKNSAANFDAHLKPFAA